MRQPPWQQRKSEYFVKIETIILPLPTVDGIRKYYDGPLVVEQDFMVFNVSKDKITQRIGIGSGSPWVHRDAKRKGEPKYRKDNLNSDYILESVIPPCKDAKGESVTKERRQNKKQGTIIFCWLF